MEVASKVPEPNKIISPARFAHIVLYTKKFKEMVDWQWHFLGAELTASSQGLAFITYDDEHHRVAIIERPDYKDRVPDTIGMAHFAYSYDSLEDMIEQYKRLKATRVMPVRTINHGVTTSLYYRDPDDNAVEIQVDNFESISELNDWFATGEFNKNPIGITFDFEDIIKSYNSGVSEKELKQQRKGSAAKLMEASDR